MTTAWDRHHDTYAHQDWIHKPSMFAEWVIQYFPASGILLDLGGGQGQDAVFFVEKGYDVTLLDFTQSALDRAKEKSLATEAMFHIVHHDMRMPLPFHPGDFDIVYAHLSLHYFTTDKTFEIFDEIHSVLKPGGVLAVMVNSTSDPEYGTGSPVEPDVFTVDDQMKHYFSVESVRTITNRFQTVVLDAEGESYKDNKIGVHHLIRYVGKK